MVEQLIFTQLIQVRFLVRVIMLNFLNNMVKYLDKILEDELSTPQTSPILHFLQTLMIGFLIILIKFISFIIFVLEEITFIFLFYLFLSIIFWAILAHIYFFYINPSLYYWDFFQKLHYELTDSFVPNYHYIIVDRYDAEILKTIKHDAKYKNFWANNRLYHHIGRITEGNKQQLVFEEYVSPQNNVIYDSIYNYLDRKLRSLFTWEQNL